MKMEEAWELTELPAVDEGRQAGRDAMSKCCSRLCSALRPEIKIKE